MADVPERDKRRWGRGGVVLALLGLLVLSACGLLDRGLDRVIGPLSPQQTRAALHGVQIRAAEAYVTARALGRVVAVASSATVNAGVAVGGSIDVGRVLQPIDKLLETFSDVMMASLVAVTAQLILLDMFDAYALSWLLPAGLAVLALAVALGSAPHGRLRHVASMLILAALLAKYALPVAVGGTEALSARFLQQRTREAAALVQATRSDVEAAEAGAGGAARAWYDPRRLTDPLGAVSPEAFVTRIDRAVDAILTWMTAFILETIAMPLAIGLATVLFARAALRRVLVVAT
jgi:hypothetical protein